MESKKDIRKRVLAERNLISKREWEEKSRKIYEKVVAHPFFLNAEEIYCYIDFRNEVSTKAIIEQTWKMNKKVAVPKISGDDMEFYYIESFDELKSGYFKIMEPENEKIAEGKKNVLVIMPGAVFDKKRKRIGYGKGFYDSYLARHSSYKTLALAFELQILDSIPSDIHDICPEVIITEENLYV